MPPSRGQYRENTQKAAPIPRRGFWEFLLVQTELLVEAADTATGVHHLLLAGVEGVTLGAHFYADVLLGGASLDHVAAGSPDGGLFIVGVEAFLHYIHLFLHGG